MTLNIVKASADATPRGAGSLAARTPRAHTATVVAFPGIAHSPNHRVTSVDVARRAGVSQSTVSLVFSGKGPGGSIVVPAPADGQLSSGIIWTIAVPLLAALIVGWPSFARPAASSAHASVSGGTTDEGSTN